MFEVFEPKNQKSGKICAGNPTSMTAWIRAMRVFRFHSDFTPATPTSRKARAEAVRKWNKTLNGNCTEPDPEPKLTRANRNLPLTMT
jgi:hypothetical protein